MTSRRYAEWKDCVGLRGWWRKRRRVLLVTARNCLLSQSHGCGQDRDLILGTSTAFSCVVPFWWIAMGETLLSTDWAFLLLACFFGDGSDHARPGSS